MIWFLRFLFSVVLVSMIALTGWASHACPLFAIPPDVLHHPWFLATLADAYWAFLAFFVFVAWKQRDAVSRVGWFIAIMLLGNISIAAFFLRELFRISRSEEIAEIFSRREVGRRWLPILLSVLGLVIYAVAWRAKSGF